MAFLNPQKIVDDLSLKGAEVVVDLGFGSGVYSLALAKAVGPDGKVIAIDVRPEMTFNLSKLAKEQNLLNINCFQINFAKKNSLSDFYNTAAAVIMSNVLFQVDKAERETACNEAAKLLAHNGQLIFLDWSDSFGGLGPQPEDLVLEKDARLFFEQAGLLFKRPIFAGDHHFGLVFNTR